MRKHTALKRHAAANLPGVICGAFALIILLGGILLSLPCASRNGSGIGLLDGLFTSTSAVCVTGLVVRDTATSFNLFGQIVLLCLIELGGLGFMTFATLAFRLLGRGVSLRERMLIRESLNESGTGGMDALIRWVAKCAFSVQAAGAAALAVRFVPMFGWGKGLYYSVFHAVSAFCNAGFDLFGNFSSLTGFRADVLVNITVMALVIVGGLGFSVLRDLLVHRRDGRLHMQTRLVLVFYGILLAFGALFVLLAEWNNPATLGPLPVGEKLLAALFQSVTLRTAGFNTISQQALHPATKLVGALLMLIGASPASTGGGVKVTTFAVLLLAASATVRGEESIVAFRRNISFDLLRRALAVVVIAVSIVLVDLLAISLMQPELDFMDLLMECASAMGTVGISAFGSARLNILPRILIMITMYLGRIGPLTMALLLSNRSNRPRANLQYPGEQLMIG